MNDNVEFYLPQALYICARLRRMAVWWLALAMILYGILHITEGENIQLQEDRCNKQYIITIQKMCIYIFKNYYYENIYIYFLNIKTVVCDTIYEYYI